MMAAAITRLPFDAGKIYFVSTGQQKNNFIQ
jgi:hypothetical protein